jgi:hypothetical protein
MSVMPTQSACLSGILLALFTSVVSSRKAAVGGGDPPQCPILVSDFSSAMTECAEMVLRNALSVGAVRCLTEVGGRRGRAAFSDWHSASAVADFVAELAAACSHIQRAPGLTADALRAAAEATDVQMQVNPA